MDTRQVRDVLFIYEKKFKEHGIKPLCIRESSADLTIHNREIRHLAWMIDEIRKMLDEGDMEKVMRWLGFLQGALWTYEWYKLDELRDHNR